MFITGSCCEIPNSRILSSCWPSFPEICPPVFPSFPVPTQITFFHIPEIMSMYVSRSEVPSCEPYRKTKIVQAALFFCAVWKIFYFPSDWSHSRRNPAVPRPKGPGIPSAQPTPDNNTYNSLLYITYLIWWNLWRFSCTFANSSFEIIASCIPSTT